MDSGTLKRVMDEIARPTTRSDLFWWLYKYHDRIVAEARGARLNWHVLACRFNEAGLTNARGEPATTEGARQTWKRVRATLARERATAEQVAATARAQGKTREAPGPFVVAARPASVVSSASAPSLPPANRPPKARWYDEDPSIPVETRERLRAEDERSEAAAERRRALRSLG